ncbi:IS5 family transposase [Acidicapsa ligni]|uniref:IS5 family transposase n=1 Tax=Acidicapsa ligni TaxID=542300 RepID=UPI0021E0E493|nr:IS5 family transposase [Acidicapsa ligni]
MSLKGQVGYPSDVTDEEWGFVLSYLLLCREDSLQRKYHLRSVFNAVRYVARTGGQWRFLSNDMPPWYAVFQQMQRWLKWGCFEILVEDTRSLVREWAGRKGQPTTVYIDSRTLQSTPKFGGRAGYDGTKRRKGSKVHIAVDTLGHLLALTVTPASDGDREQVAALPEEIQQVTRNSVELAFVDQGYTGPNATEAAQQYGLRLEVVKHPMAKWGFVLPPRRWVVERSFAWAARFRRLARDYERLDTTLKVLHLLAFPALMLRNLANTLNQSS